MGLFRKARALVLGQTSAILDRVIDLDSVPVVEQYVRDLEEAIKTVTRSAAEAMGQVDGQNRKIAALNEHIDQKKADAKLLFTDDDTDNDKDGETILEHVANCKDELQGFTDELQELEATAEGLAKTKERMKAKHGEMMRRLVNLRRMDRTTKAKERAADAIQAAGSAMSGADSTSVDNLVERMQSRSDAANAVLNDAMGSMTDSTEESVAKARAKQRIAQMKAELLGKPADAPAK
jgi:phage shock protein A